VNDYHRTAPKQPKIDQRHSRGRQRQQLVTQRVSKIRSVGVGDGAASFAEANT